MKAAPQHLNEQVAQYLDLPLAKRIERIRSPRWIGYTRTKNILAKLEDLYSYPRSHRMPNLLIIGDTNNGKTMLVQQFHARHEPDDNLEGESAIVPVLYVQAPPVPDEGRFYEAILDLLFAPYRPSDRVSKKQSVAITLLKRVGLRVLMIDEIQHILAGSTNKQRAFLNVIKYLGNELQVPIVGIGTQDAYRAIQSDPQLANRFEPVALPRWEPGEEYLRLLMSFERMIPLREPSKLHSQALAARLLSMSEGLIGELSRILVTAAVRAAESGKEHIDTKLLDNIGWTPPSKRKYRAI